MTAQDMDYYTHHEVRVAKRDILQSIDPWSLEPGTQLYGRHESGLAPMLFTVEHIEGPPVARRLTYHGAQVLIPDLVE